LIIDAIILNPSDFDNQSKSYSRPSKATDNAFIESFNGNLREECLSFHWLMSLEYAREKLEKWRWDYICFRSH